MFTLVCSDVGYGREYISTVGGRALDTISMVNATLSSFVIDIKVLEIVVEIDGAGAEVPAEEGCVCGENSGNIDMSLATKGYG
jgi:hypothetical protein